MLFSILIFFFVFCLCSLPPMQCFAENDFTKSGSPFLESILENEGKITPIEITSSEKEIPYLSFLDTGSSALYDVDSRFDNFDKRRLRFVKKSFPLFQREFINGYHNSPIDFDKRRLRFIKRDLEINPLGDFEKRRLRFVKKDVNLNPFDQDDFEKRRLRFVKKNYGSEPVENLEKRRLRFVKREPDSEPFSNDLSKRRLRFVKKDNFELEPEKYEDKRRLRFVKKSDSFVLDHDFNKRRLRFVKRSADEKEKRRLRFVKKNIPVPSFEKLENKEMEDSSQSQTFDLEKRQGLSVNLPLRVLADKMYDEEKRRNQKKMAALIRRMKEVGK